MKLLQLRLLREKSQTGASLRCGAPLCQAYKFPFDRKVVVRSACEVLGVDAAAVRGLLTPCLRLCAARLLPCAGSASCPRVVVSTSVKGTSDRVPQVAALLTAAPARAHEVINPFPFCSRHFWCVMLLDLDRSESCFCCAASELWPASTTAA
jgi:hypothetical protein